MASTLVRTCALVLLVAVAGCSAQVDTGGSPDSAAPAASSEVIDIAPLRQTDFDYEPAGSPEELVRRGHDVVVAGEVETVVQAGEESVVPGDGNPLLYVAMKVRVTDPYRVRSPDLLDDGYVYAILSQGPRSPDGTPSYSLEDWNRAIPPGTPILLLAGPAEEGVVGPDSEVPDGARAVAPDVQGLVLEGLIDGRRQLENGLEEFAAGWKGIESMDALKDRVASAIG